MHFNPTHTFFDPKSQIFDACFETVNAMYYTINNNNSHEKRYRIIIDGGSTGSRIHIFEYNVNENGAIVLDFSDGAELGSMRVSPGLSAFVDDLDGAGESVNEMMEFARERVPGEKWGESEVRLMATGGLRMLGLGGQERVLEACRKVLRGSGFLFKDDWASDSKEFNCYDLKAEVVKLMEGVKYKGNHK
ncbi:probable apyrase 6 [Tanacetum coccineum]